MRPHDREPRRFTCELTGEKTHDREVGYCWEGNRHLIRELGMRIVASGFALARPRYSTRYLPFETEEAKSRQMRAPYCVGLAPAAPLLLGAVAGEVSPGISAAPKQADTVGSPTSVMRSVISAASARRPSDRAAFEEKTGCHRAGHGQTGGDQRSHDLYDLPFHACPLFGGLGNIAGERLPQPK